MHSPSQHAVSLSSNSPAQSAWFVHFPKTIEPSTEAQQQSLSRTIFAYSRDGMLPLSRVWTRINSKTTTPLFAVWVSVLAPILITQIGLGSYAAVSAIFNTSTAALDCGYAIPIATKLIFRRFKPGPFSLGMFSSVINLYSVIWTMYITVLFLFPTVRPVTLINVSFQIPYQ